MDRKKIQLLIGVLIFGFLAFAVGNYFFLKLTVKWPEQATPDSSALLSEEDALHLTWDISGKSGPPGAKAEDLEKKKEEEKKQQRQETLAMVDSVVNKGTSPIEQKVQGAKKELTQTKAQVSDLERLIAVLASKSDSVDTKNAQRLSKIIEQMKPADAAAILNRLSSRTSAELILKMRQRQAAKILAALPRERAAEVAQFLSRAYARSSI